MLLTVCHVEPIFLRQFLAYLFITVAVVLVGNGLAVVVYSVEYDVAMRMLSVGVTDNDELRIADAHSLHVFASNFYHQAIIVSQAGTVLW